MSLATPNAHRVLKRFARQLDRSMQIARYHRPEQLLRRLAYRWRDQWSTPCPSQISESDARLRTLDATPTMARRSGNNARDLALGEVTLLNQPHQLGWPIRWNARDQNSLSSLAEFHLQYHEFLLDAALWTGEGDSSTVVLQAISCWLDAYEHDTRGPAWHPYCISRRVPVWLALLSILSIESDMRSRIERSLASQADWLLHRLERDLGGNHLWENARALAIAGSAFEGPRADHWFEVGGSLLDECIDTQILPGGEHFERTPAYQAELASGLEEAAFWTHRRDRETSARWASVAFGMTQFLDGIRHPDGTIPLFGDSTLDAPRARSTPTAPVSSSKWVGDYYVRRTDGRCLIFDAGDMAENSLPAHAHADLTQFELSVGDHRLIVDSGVACYTGPKRLEYRQSNAHNVLMIDGRNHADVWSSFRMGHRGQITARSQGRLADASWVQVWHDAYRRVGVPDVARIWLFLDAGDWFCFDVALPSDNRTHSYNSMLHWAPGVEMTPKLGGWIASIGDVSCEFAAIGPATIANRLGIYAERFSREQRRLATERRWQATGPTVSGWMIGSNTPNLHASIEEVDGRQRLSILNPSNARTYAISLEHGHETTLDMMSVGD